MQCGYKVQESNDLKKVEATNSDKRVKEWSHQTEEFEKKCSIFESLLDELDQNKDKASSCSHISEHS